MEICGQFTDIQRKNKQRDYSNYADLFPYTNSRKLAVNYRELFFTEMAITLSEITRNIILNSYFFHCFINTNWHKWLLITAFLVTVGSWKKD